MRRILVILCTAFLLPVALAAAELGPDVAVYRGQELKWEQGAYGYHVMFKSLLANLSTDDDYDGEVFNPKADACLEQSTYHLDASKIPADATVVKAFLVWTGAQPIAAIDDFTDDQVRLDFVHEAVAEMNVGMEVVGRQSRLTDAQDFEFEAIAESDTLGERGFFTHRVDVTDFFRQIQENGWVNEVSNGDADGLSLLGDYTVSGLDCATDAVYRDNGLMVSSWSLVLVYTSALIAPQNVYLYAGFHSYQHANSLIQIIGFEFPDQPKIKLTLNVNGGDTGQIDPAVSVLPESLSIRGEYVAFDPLTNVCNPSAETVWNETPFIYTEIFNGISSEYGFDATNGEYCIGGVSPDIDPTTMEHGIDMDTFYIDGAEYPWMQQFFMGGQHIILNLGVNQDRILSNFLVLSHDVRHNPYDIPPHLDHPENVYEKGYCACSYEENAVCFEQEFIYFIRVQNWGDDIVAGVKVQDILPDAVDYIPGTTQIATQIQDGESGEWRGWDWMAIPDGPSGTFPLAQPYLVADYLDYCELWQGNCPGDHDRRLIRFKVQPKQGIPKHTIIENIALISDPATTSKPYKTNTAVPLKLHSGSCLPLAECYNYEEECAPSTPPDYDIINDEDVLPDYDVIPPDCRTAGVKVMYAVGPNSPSDNIIIPDPSPDLVLGQFSLLGETESGKHDCFFALNMVRVKVERSDTVQLSNFELVYDLNGNGKYEEGETILATTYELQANYIEFFIPSTRRFFTENERHYFLVMGDASVAGSVQPNTVFRAKIDEPASFIISDDGDATAVGDPIAFAQFMFEPDGSFIITRGVNDPSAPLNYIEVNTDREVLQVRTKAKGDPNELKAMTIRVPDGGYAYFGEGLERVSLWLDADGDGTADSLLAEGAAAKGESEITLKLDKALAYDADEEKYLVIKADFNLLYDGDKGRIGIISGGLDLENAMDIWALPIYSKEYINTSGAFPCCTPPPSCGCSLVF